MSKLETIFEFTKAIIWPTVNVGGLVPYQPPLGTIADELAEKIKD